MRKVYVEVGDGILLFDRDNWVTGSDYEAGDMVQNTGSYVCTVPHTAGSTTEPGVGANYLTVWKLIAIGSQGIPGGVMAWKGAHNSGTTYAINDAVFANGSGYYSLQNGNLNHTPPAGTSDAYWSIFALAGSFDIHVLAAKSPVVAADEVPLYSIADSANKKMTLTSLIAAFITNSTAWTPTGTWTTNTTYSGFWRKVGDYGYYRVLVYLTGAPTSAFLTINLPAGHTIDAAKLFSVTVGWNQLGYGTIIDSDGSTYHVTVHHASENSVIVNAMKTDAAYEKVDYVTQAVPITFASSDVIIITFEAPISGWT